MVARMELPQRGLSDLVDKAIADDKRAADWSRVANSIRPAGPRYDGDPFSRLVKTELGARVIQSIGNEGKALGEIGDFAANIFGRALNLPNGIKYPAWTIVVYHGKNRVRRSLLILDPHLDPDTAPRVVDADSWSKAVLKMDLGSSDLHPDSEQNLFRPVDASEALWIARPRLIIAPAPQVEYTCVPQPPDQVLCNSAPSTVGACVRDQYGTTGVTVCHHGTGDAATRLKIDGVDRVVGKAAPIVDTCFVAVPESYMPTVALMAGRRGVLTSRAPGAQEQHNFWSRGTRHRTVATGHDLGVPYHIRGSQQRVYTDPVTNYGDSGGALVNQYDELVGFAFQRTPHGTPVQFASWIWANSAFQELGLTPY